MASIESFDDLVHLSDTQTHALLGRIDQEDVKRAVSGGDEAARQVKEKLFAAMSERVRKFMEEDLEIFQFDDIEIQKNRVIGFSESLNH